MATYEDALKKYPDWAWAFNIPEVGDLLKKGVEDPNYDPIPEILQTNWYRTTQASSRQWQALKQSDPESANAHLREREAQIWDMRSKLGINPDPDWVRNAAEKSLNLGWSADGPELNDYLVSLLKYNPQVSTAAGSLSVTMQQVKTAASQYMVKISDQTAFDYAKSILAGEHTIDDWNSVWAQNAKTQFPTIADYIDKGITPTQYFAPVQQRIATILETSPDTIDLTSPQWSKVLDVADDKGNHRPMTYNEVDTFARSQDAYKQTRQGKQAASDLAETLLNKFGKVAA